MLKNILMQSKLFLASASNSSSDIFETLKQSWWVFPVLVLILLPINALILRKRKK